MNNYNNNDKHKLKNIQITTQTLDAGIQRWSIKSTAWESVKNHSAQWKKSMQIKRRYLSTIKKKCLRENDDRITWKSATVLHGVSPTSKTSFSPVLCNFFWVFFSFFFFFHYKIYVRKILRTPVFLANSACFPIAFSRRVQLDWLFARARARVDTRRSVK